MSSAARQSSTSGGGGGTKKLTIKLKSKPVVPESFLDTTWRSLESALEAVWERRATDLGQEELYSKVQDLCLHRHGGETYVRLYKAVDKHIAQMIANVWDSNHHLASKPFLETFAKLWLEHSEQMKAIRLIFTVLDRSPKCMMQTEVPATRSLWEMGLLLFRTHLEANESCLTKLLDDVLDVIREERQWASGGEATMFTFHHEILRMFSSLGIYASRFEHKFLAATEQFYAQESNEAVSSSTVPDYLIACERRFSEETKRSQEYLDSFTRKPLRKIVEQQLLCNHAQTLLDRGLDQLLDDEARLGDVARMFRLYSLVSLQSLLMKGYVAHTKARGLALVSDDENADLVGTLLQFKAKVDRVLTEAFESDAAFAKATRDVFESFLNSQDNKLAELIAKYADKALRSTNTADSFQVLQKTIELFRFIHAKDVFEEFYKKSLAKRLLLGTSSSNELEKMMISNLKKECGASFTNKLEGMFRDMDLGRELNQEYQRSLFSVEPRAVETTVQVLSRGFWPNFADSPVKLSPLLATEQDRFKRFYDTKYQGRLLQWVNSLTHCIVKAFLPKGRWELEVSLFQALVLLLFNDGVRSLTYAEIAELTGISHEELTRTMQSLALGRKEERVLLRTSKGSTPAIVVPPSSGGKNDDDSDEDDAKGAAGGPNGAASGSSSSKMPCLEDVFQVNTSWSSKKLRLKINQVQAKETKKENEDAHKRVAQDRHYQIDAAIVRIMKARKRLVHNMLVTELFKQLSFPAKPQDLKKRIENLIEREYLERSETDPNEYVYLA